MSSSGAGRGGGGGGKKESILELAKVCMFVWIVLCMYFMRMNGSAVSCWILNVMICPIWQPRVGVFCNISIL